MWRSIVVRTVSGALRLTGTRMRTFGTPPPVGCVIGFHHNSPIDALVIGHQAWTVGHHPIAMVHSAVFRAPVIGHIVTRAGMVPVDRADRTDRQAAFDHSVAQARAGHTMFIAPESGISRSFTVQDLRHGATRLAIEADAPLVPVVTFGTQRFGGSHGQSLRPRRRLAVDVWWGEPIEVTTVEETTARLQTALESMLETALDAYPDNGEGAWWWPRHLGGAAPTPAEAIEAKRVRDAARAARH